MGMSVCVRGSDVAETATISYGEATDGGFVQSGLVMAIETVRAVVSSIFAIAIEELDSLPAKTASTACVSKSTSGGVPDALTISQSSLSWVGEVMT